MGESKILDRLTGVFNEGPIRVVPQLSARDLDGWDSLTNIRLILTIERVFKIKFSSSEIGKLENVGDMVALIKARS